MDLVGAVLAVFLVLLRVLAFFMWLPVIGGDAIPAKVRVGFSVAITLAVTALQPPPVLPVMDTGPLLLAVASEVTLGIGAAMVAKMMFLALEGAGNAIGGVMGMGFAQSFNPLTGGQTNPASKLLTLAGVATALHLGFPGEAIAWLHRSLEVFPIGAPLDLNTLAQGVIVHAVGSITLAIRIGFPIVGAVTLGHISLGLLGRTAPQLNVQSVGFSIAVVAGGATLFATTLDISRVVVNAMLSAMDTIVA